MTNEIDILSIDNEIKEKFNSEKSKLDEYKAKLIEINNTLKLINIRPRVKTSLLESKIRLEQQIYDIENNNKYNFYISEVTSLLEKYKIILNEPLKVNFMGKSVRKNKDKDKLISDYLDIVSKYTEINISIYEKKEKIVCKNCNNKKDFDIVDGNIYICHDCSAQQVILKNVSSYRDIDRVNISNKYLYDRKIHFRDCINQHQGKQNSTIQQQVYDDLEDQFRKHHLLVEDTNDKKLKFSKITKDHILMFLKELEYTKHYENANLIHYNITGKKPDDIGYLEDALLNDFDTLTELYDKKFKHLDRKNFINTQYVLFQLLLRHKHPCNKDDFNILKTVDRKTFHDEICKSLFEELGWNFSPFY